MNSSPSLKREKCVKSLKIKPSILSAGLLPDCSIPSFLLFCYLHHKKYPLIMQVDNSTLHFTTLAPQEDTHSTSLFPLHDYHQRLSITAPAWPLPAFATHITSLPAELIDMIQAFCAHDDLLSLTSVDKAALATRFCNPRLQKLCFKTVTDIEQFLSYCQAVQEKEAQARILEEGQKSRKRLKSALSSDPTMRFISFTQEQLQAVKALTLTLSEQFTAEQYNLLFTYLPRIQYITIYSMRENQCTLGTLFKAAQHLTLHSLAIFNTDDSHGRRNFNKIEEHLLDGLWQFTALEALTISGFKDITSIEEIGQLKALKSLTLDNLRLLNALPASLGQLNKLEGLTLKWLNNITALPKEIGQLNALRSLTLNRMSLNA
jgi:hypothetical protein